jgi:hypothetical protein
MMHRVLLLVVCESLWGDRRLIWHDVAATLHNGVAWFQHQWVTHKACVQQSLHAVVADHGGGISEFGSMCMYAYAYTFVAVVFSFKLLWHGWWGLSPLDTQRLYRYFLFALGAIAPGR